MASGRVSAGVAALGRRWILFALTAILVIFALFTAHIPFTAFAFLGGALAIAAGFGLQTLLKNLVSGVMLLVERRCESATSLKSTDCAGESGRSACVPR